MIRVRLTTDHDGAICLESPYDAGFVATFKQAIPYGGRQWDATRKRWIVSALYAAELLAYLGTVGAQVQDDRQAPLAPSAAGVAMPAELAQAFATLTLAPDAPLCAAEAVYRALAKVTHPDHGGTAEAFGRLSEAITTIRRYLAPSDDDIPF